MASKIKRENVTAADLVVKKTPKASKLPKDVRTIFRGHLKSLDIEKLKKPWMAAKAFRIVNTAEDLQAWVNSVIADRTRYFEIHGELMPVVAVDTEGIGLDTRLFWSINADGQPVYEVMTDTVGLCLSSNGIEGIYVSLAHEFEDQAGTPAQNISREDVRRILQPLFDICHLVFYNAKFDREILRLCLGLRLRPYPYFEDVQVLYYIADPKADVGDKKKGQYTGDTGGLKALSRKLLDMEMIELDELVKIKGDWCPVTESGECNCTAEERKINKHTQRIQYVPFSWVPLNVALWYAASDAICTWLLWEKLSPIARQQKFVHKIDGELVDALTWLERQRFVVDIARRSRIVKWHEETIHGLENQLREIAVKNGWKVETEEDGTVIEDTVFNPGSNPQVVKLLFTLMGLKSAAKTAKGAPSVAAEAMSDLIAAYPDNEFLQVFAKYKEYIALHPENLTYDKRDNSARIYLKQTVVAGGRLSGAGGNFPIDGGFGLNPQGIVRVEGNWWVKGNVLEPDTILEEEIEEHAEADLHPSCFKEVEEDIVETVTKDYEGYTREEKVVTGKRKVKKKAKNIVKNHIGFYQGYAICLVPSCKTCDANFNIIYRNGRADANEVVNIRALFAAQSGWTFFTIDYSNIEMRAAANVSQEPEFIKEFLEGSGDFHTLTASKVFPEFNDPKTDKATKKALRSLAKIINFALLYGGTEYTIYENMKKQNPDITWDEAKSMVEKYWAGVPIFADWCVMKQQIAKEKMICKTSTGRVINFQSAMEALHIHTPTKLETENYWAWRKLVKKEEEARAEGDTALADQLHEQTDRMWKSPETGVRNYQDHNRFMGKIGRVAVNVPLQGLAGDFMRLSLDKIKAWVCDQEPAIQSVMRFHCSVHDEIDFAVKNEYVPFILPRLTRIMKLRKLHAHMKWQVPIECDMEYGRSWDVEHHVTGDDSHKPAAWTEIEGMENYLPKEFEQATVDALLRSLNSEVDAKIDKAKSWLKDAVHPRAYTATKTLYDAKDEKARRKALMAVLQLHEYWSVDHTPDDTPLETFEAWESQNGLSVANRGTMPPDGFLGPVDTSRATYPKIMKLTTVENPLTAITNAIVDHLNEMPPEERGEKLTVFKQELGGTLPLSNTVESDVLLDTPIRKKKKATTSAVLPPSVDDGIPEIVDFTPDVAKAFASAVGFGLGENTLRVRYQGKILTFSNLKESVIPKEFLKSRTTVEGLNGS